MDTTHGITPILRDARKSALLWMRSEIISQTPSPVTTR
jgi:predicted 2-oxoglutarate/Fe(II)-dependent dioxygenase YbiX